MAKEVRGLLSEAVTVAALEEIGYTYGRDVYWQSTPTSLKVCDSDILIGSDKNDPKFIFQVCSSGYAGGYQKKFWRDTGELIEIKNKLKDTGVISIIYEPGIREKLKKVYEYISEGVVSINKTEAGLKVLKYIREVDNNKVPTQKDDKLKKVKKDLNSKTIKKIGRHIKKKKKEGRKKVWNINHSKSKSVNSREINMRRAILSVALFSSGGNMDNAKEHLKSVKNNKTLPHEDFLESLEEVGLCKKTLGGYRIEDENLVKAVDSIGVSELLDISKKTVLDNPDSRILDYIYIIHNLNELTEVWFKKLKDKFEKITQGEELASAIYRNFDDYNLWMPKSAPDLPEPWIFRRVMDLVRAIEGKHYAIGIPRFDEKFKEEGFPALRTIISEYIAGRRSLTKGEAGLLGSLLSKEVHKRIDKIPSSLSDEFADKTIRSEYSQRLLTYRGFRPIKILSDEKFGKGSIKITPDVVKKAGVNNAATCEVIRDKNKMIMWQGASDKGVSHKIKENVGRMGLVSLESQEINDKIKFEFKNQHDKRIIYIDGSWSEENVQALLSSCFTDVRNIT